MIVGNKDIDNNKRAITNPKGLKFVINNTATANRQIIQSVIHNKAPNLSTYVVFPYLALLSMNQFVFSSEFINFVHFNCNT